MRSTKFGVSKVLLLFVVICRLPGRLGLKWALFLESPWFYTVYSKVVFKFFLQLHLFSNCIQKNILKVLKLLKEVVLELEMGIHNGVKRMFC